MNQRTHPWLIIAIATCSLTAAVASLIVGPVAAAATPNDIENLRRFAEKYQPQSTKQNVVPEPPVLNEKTLQALKALAAEQSRVHEKYIVLIFVRLYRFHLEHFQQSYDLAEVPENPLTQEFRRLTGSPRYEMLSSVAEDWVQKTPELLEYPPIKKEMVRIEKARRRINSQEQGSH